MTQHIVTWAVDIIAYSAIIPVVLFVYFYGTRRVEGKRLRRFSGLWHTTAIGRTLMYQNIAWACYLALTASSVFLGEWPGKVLVLGAVYVLLVALFWRLFMVLRSVQRSGVADHNAEGVNVNPPQKEKS